MRERMHSFLIVAIVGFCIISFTIGSTTCYFTTNKTSNLTACSAWISDIWVTTTKDNFSAGVPNNVDLNSSPGNVTLNYLAGAVPRLFALEGGNSAGFWEYNNTTNTWISRAPNLLSVNAGGSLAYDLNNSIYALAGGNSKNFTKYDILTNTWISRADTLLSINAGGSLAYGDGYVYALAGGNTRNFTRYNTSTNIWESRADTLENINTGGALTYANGFVYALSGGGNTTFMRYNITNNSWALMASTPAGVGEGGALTYDGGNYIYGWSGGIQGGQAALFWRYDISANTWTSLDNAPNPVKIGGALAYCCNDRIYAFRGLNSKQFWFYNNQTTDWDVTLQDTTNAIGAGGSLVCVCKGGIPCYQSPGVIASIVFDTMTAGSRWDVLAWNATIPTGTNITFEVRASNTLFLKTDASPAWTTVTGTLIGGTYYVYYPALPIGRYLQWRANLTSTICANTPVLYDVTVYYTDP